MLPYTVVHAFLLFTEVTAGPGLYNAALFKPAAQISTYIPYHANLAVDGNKNPNVYDGHCQHTLMHLTPWWMVDLRGQFVVEQIKLTNR
ncbi:fucolectin-7 [Biomphalaria glabrata]|nr:fucolectin-7-like [Biomphalaria glabrata]